MTPEQKAREIIDRKLEQSGWIVQDMKQLNLSAGLGVAVREFPTSTGPVDYALFVEGKQAVKMYKEVMSSPTAGFSISGLATISEEENDA